MNTTDTTFELIISESYAGEIECESRHKRSTCTIEVTSVISGCDDHPDKICNGAVASSLKFMKEEGYCADCGRLARDCWSIRPI